MEKRRKVLYVSYDGLTDPLGQSQILPYLLGLEKKGYDFTVLSFEKKGSFTILEGRILSLLKDTNITWIPKFYTKKPPVFSTLFDLWVMYLTLRKIGPDHDILHARSYLPMLVFQIIQKNQHVLFDMRGLWADERVEGKIWPQKKGLYRMIYRFFLKKESDFIDFTHGIVSLSHAGLKALTERYPTKTFLEKATVIPCCVNTTLFDPLVSSPLTKEALGFPATAKILVHVGSIGTWYRFDREVALYIEMHKKDPNWYFLVLTKDLEQARRTLSEMGVESQKIKTLSAQYAEVPSYLWLADLSVFFIEPSFSKQASFPVKMAESMAMGVPMVTNEGTGDVAEILRDSHAGVALPSLSDKDLEQFDFSVLHFDRAKIQAYAQTMFSVERGVEKYDEIYRRMKEIQ